MQLREKSDRWVSGQANSHELRLFDPEFELLSRRELETLQLQKLKEMLRHVSKTNAFYSGMWIEAGVNVEDIKSLEDFSKAIPMVEKDDFVQDQISNPPFGSRLEHSMSLHERLDMYTTSGTSRRGVEFHAQTRRELTVMQHIYGFYFRWAGLQPGDSAMLTLPITMLAGGRVEYQGAVGYDLTVYPVGNYSGKRKVELLQQLGPKALYGSTSYFAHLGTLMESDPSSSSVEILLTGLEGAGFCFLNRLEEQWRARVADRFGCAQMRADFMFTDERGVGDRQAPGVLYNIDPFVYLEVLDTSTGLPVADGEYGELVVTSLYHFDNPVIRNRLHDGGVFRLGGACGSRRSFNGIEIASISRTDDVKKVKGINLHPRAIDDLLFSIKEVQQYEVVLTSKADFSDVATIRVLPRSEPDSRSDLRLQDFIKDSMKEKIGINFDVEITREMDVSDYKARRWNDRRRR